MTDCPAGICDGRNCEHFVVIYDEPIHGEDCTRRSAEAHEIEMGRAPANTAFRAQEKCEVCGDPLHDTPHHEEFVI